MGVTKLGYRRPWTVLRFCTRWHYTGCVCGGGGGEGKAGEGMQCGAMRWGLIDCVSSESRCIGIAVIVESAPPLQPSPPSLAHPKSPSVMVQYGPAVEG